jgi:hypothetical protein
MLVVSVDAVAAGVEFDKDPSNNAFDLLWNTLAELRGEAGSITATLQYPRVTYGCVIELPLPTPKDLSAFDSIPGLVFTKKDSAAEESVPLYQVSVKQGSTYITGIVEFSSPVEARIDALEKLVSRSDQIAKFALVQKSQDSVHD